GTLIGKHLRQLPCDPPLDRRVAEFDEEAAARSGAPLVSELAVRGAQDGDGTLFIEAGITSLVLRGERFWLTMLQDATARRQLEREVLEASNGERGLLRIEDNGSGFNPAMTQSKGLGLRIMHYRAQMMAGSLRIESGRARGTIISCWFPRQG